MRRLVAHPVVNEILHELRELVEDQRSVCPELLLLVLLIGLFRLGLNPRADLQDAFKGFEALFKKVLRLPTERHVRFNFLGGSCIVCCSLSHGLFPGFSLGGLLDLDCDDLLYQVLPHTHSSVFSGCAMMPNTMFREERVQVVLPAGLRLIVNVMRGR